MEITKEMVERGILALAKTHWGQPRAERDPEQAFDSFVKHMRCVWEREVRAVLEAALNNQ